MAGSHTARFCYSNVLTTGAVSITSSSDTTSLPDDNVTHPWRTKVWRATNNSLEWVQFNLPSAQAVQQVAIFNHNFTAGATVTLLGATNADFSPTALTTPLTNNATSILHNYSSPETYQYWRLQIEDSTNADNVEVGFAFLGEYVEFDYRPGFRYQVIDPSESVFSDGGQRASYVKDKYRAVGFNLGDHDTLNDLENIIQTVGFNTDFVLMLDPDGVAFDNIPDGLYRFTLYGSLVNWEHDHRMAGVFNTPVGFEEAR
jgi:hypothetical protein